MMVHAKLKKETQMKLWSEAFNCSGFLVNIILKVDQNEPAMEYWTGNSVRNWFNHMPQLGRIGYVSKKDKNNKKLIERGFPAITV